MDTSELFAVEVRKQVQNRCIEFYLAAYGLPTLGTFAVIALVRRSGAESSGFDAWAGLGRRRPLLGVVMTIFLLSMAGMPLTGGLIAKIMVFAAA